MKEDILALLSLRIGLWSFKEDQTIEYLSLYLQVMFELFQNKIIGNTTGRRTSNLWNYSCFRNELYFPPSPSSLSHLNKAQKGWFFLRNHPPWISSQSHLLGSFIRLVVVLTTRLVSSPNLVINIAAAKEITRNLLFHLE